jgi:hypothetical protein
MKIVWHSTMERATRRAYFIIVSKNIRLSIRGIKGITGIVLTTSLRDNDTAMGYSLGVRIISQ